MVIGAAAGPGVEALAPLLSGSLVYVDDDFADLLAKTLGLQHLVETCRVRNVVSLDSCQQDRSRSLAVAEPCSS